jgi:phycocyanin alpha chain
MGATMGLTSVKNFITSKLDGQGSYLSSTQLAQLDQTIKYSQIRLEAATQLTLKLDQLVNEATQEIEKKFLMVTSSDTETQFDNIRELVELFLKSISYALISGSTKILNDIILNGFREMLITTKQSPAWYIYALEYIKRNHGLKGEKEQEANIYIDYVISALGQFKIS